MTVIARTLVLLAALTLLAAACGDTAETTTSAPTVAATETTVAAATTTTAGPAATTTTAAPATTVPPTTPTTVPATTTTAAPTTTAATTTTASAPGGDAQEIVEAKTAAVIAAVPEGWTFADDPDQEESGDDIIFTSCLTAEDYDLDNLASDTAAVKETDVEAPADGTPFPAPSADIEARVFASRETAAFAFTALEKTLGTADGRACLAAVVQQELLADLPVGEAEPIVTIEAIDIAGADVAARIAFELTDSGLTFTFNVDYAATLVGACTVVSTFLTLGDPFPAGVADALHAAAVGAG